MIIIFVVVVSFFFFFNGASWSQSNNTINRREEAEHRFFDLGERFSEWNTQRQWSINCNKPASLIVVINFASNQTRIGFNGIPFLITHIKLRRRLAAHQRGSESISSALNRIRQEERETHMYITLYSSRWIAIQTGQTLYIAHHQPAGYGKRRIGRRRCSASQFHCNFSNYIKIHVTTYHKAVKVDAAEAE